MGRTRTRNKTGRSLAANKAEIKQASTSKATSEPSVDALFVKAQQLVIRCEYDLALKFITRVLERDQDNLEAIELLGTVNIELGNLDTARTTFRKLVDLTTSKDIPTPPSAHLYLAQLEDEDPRNALRHYQMAVDLLNTLLAKENDSRPASLELEDKELKRIAIKALISMVEIYMSDLCFEEEAESQCEQYLEMALKIEEGNLEALQCLASVRMSQQRTEDARDLVKRVWQGWKNIGDDDSQAPAPSVLLALARLFIELAEYKEAQEVLQVTLQADDEDVEAWYLRGWCYVLMAQVLKPNGDKTADQEDWEDCAKEARDSLESCQQLYVTQEHGDTDLLEHIQQLVGELDAAGVKPTQPDDDAVPEGDAEDEDEDWTDTDGEQEDVEMSHAS